MSGFVVSENGGTHSEHGLASSAILERCRDVRILVSALHIVEDLIEGTAREALAQTHHCSIPSLSAYDHTYGAVLWPSAVCARAQPVAIDHRRVSFQATSQVDESTTELYYRLFGVDVDNAAIFIPNDFEYMYDFVALGARHIQRIGDYSGLIELASSRLRTLSNQARGHHALSRRHYRTLVRGAQQFGSRLQSAPKCYHPKLVLLLRGNYNAASLDGRSRGPMLLCTHLVAASLCNVSLSGNFVQPMVGSFTSFSPLLLPKFPVIGDISPHSSGQNSERAYNNNSVVSIASQAESLQRKVRDQIQSLGFHTPPNGACEVYTDDKQRVRNLHGSQRLERLSASAKFLSSRSLNLIHHFASGREIDAAKIKPKLERIYAGTWQADLFRMAALTWSVPVSNGFGRRIRYIVWDAHNEKLMGLIAIGDPVFNLSVRDTLIGWDAADRSDRLVNVMDAYVLGAMPPYNMLLAGKMVACLVRSRQVYDDFSSTYGEAVGIISGKAKQPRLLSVTTSSSMGRSSVYNRLKLGGVQYFQPIGYTRGWGHFHISEGLFLELRDYLRSIGHEYADQHRFGHGPNWRLRTTRAALEELGFRDNPLRHGVRRQVFMCNLASNAASILRTGKGCPDLSGLLTVQQVADLALDRWIVPRARRRSDYRRWNRSDVLKLLGDPVQLSYCESQQLNFALAAD